mmetsp:Transcript_1008/g.2454  ORF Transcript_1008/g.2454 Transcript_1008/m.2454 type:complete len:291 (+) Transcript_1008:4717-5589(+)
MQREDAVHRTDQHVVGLVLLAGRGEHHAHEVAGVAEVVLRVDVGLADGVLVGHGHQRGHLGDQADRRDLAVLGVMDVGAVVIEGRHRAHQAGHDGHRVGVTAEAAQEVLHLFMHHGVVHDLVFEVGLLAFVRQLSVQQQITGLEVVAVHRELFDRVATVEQFALVAIDVGDGRVARGGAQEARVVGELAGLAVELADVDDIRSDAALVQRQIHRGAAVGERQGGFHVGRDHGAVLWVLKSDSVRGAARPALRARQWSRGHHWVPCGAAAGRAGRCRRGPSARSSPRPASH